MCMWLSQFWELSWGPPVVVERTQVFTRWVIESSEMGDQSRVSMRFPTWECIAGGWMVEVWLWISARDPSRFWVCSLQRGRSLNSKGWFVGYIQKLPYRFISISIMSSPTLNAPSSDWSRRWLGMGSKCKYFDESPVRHLYLQATNWVTQCTQERKMWCRSTWSCYWIYFQSLGSRNPNERKTILEL
jgi:hypothetical protein